MKLAPVALVALLALVPHLPAALAHPEHPDCGTGVEAGDNYNTATLVTTPRECDAQLNDTWDSTDFYKFDCAMGRSVTVTLTSASRTINLRAYVPMPVAPYVLPPPTASDSTAGDGVAKVTFMCTVSGPWRIQVLNGGLEQEQLDIPYRLKIA